MQEYDKGQIFYWSIQTCSRIMLLFDRSVSPSSDSVPPSTDRYCLLLNQYHHIPTSTAPYWPSTTKYQSIPTYTDPVSSYINQCRLPLTQYRQVPTSTTPYWPGTTKYQPVSTYTVVAWGLQTPAKFTLGLVILRGRRRQDHHEVDKIVLFFQIVHVYPEHYDWAGQMIKLGAWKIYNNVCWEGIFLNWWSALFVGTGWSWWMNGRGK